MSAYQIFLDNLAQLEQDQSLYETDLGGPELQGIQHEEIVKLGGRLCKRLQKFAEMGQTFAETLPPDFTTKLTDTIQSYQNLIVPPKIFGGFCPCLKPARSGPEYDKKLLTVKAKMVASFFVCQAVIVESRGEKINMDSMHYADYVNKMNTVFNGLGEIKCGGGEKSLESARKKLLVSLEGVEKFISNFGDSGGKNEFQAEAKRRIKSTQELLTSRQTRDDGQPAMPLSKRVLIKAQSSMQEIMNSAAAIALTEAKDNLNMLDTLQKALKKARDLEVSTFNAMEEPMHGLQLMEVLHRLREDSEVHHSDAASKLRDAIKRWTSIKSQSNARKVVEYEEEQDFTKISNVVPDPLKALNNVGKGVSNMGGKVKNGTLNGMNHTGQDIKQLGDTIKGGFTDGFMNLKNLGDKAVKDIGSTLNINNEPPTPPPKPVKTGLAKYNPIDAMMGTESDTTSGNGKKRPAPKKAPSKVSTILDSFN